MRAARLACIALLVAELLLSQSSTAEIRGLVSDESGAVIPGALVEVVHLGTREARTFTTDASGQYIVPQLIPGSYEIRASAQGFRKLVRQGVVLQVDQRASIDIKMQVGSVTEILEIVASTPLLDTTEASLGQVVENRKILDLPLNGRNILALAALTSGVTPGTSFGVGIPDGRAALVQAAMANVQINGGMASSNDVLLDGVPLALCCQHQISFQPSIDTTQEFRVRTNMYDAQYGRTGGGVITFASRGGSNEFHGSLYHFLRNDNLDANNFFNNRSGLKKGHFVYNQFGGRIGGPVVRNKLFFFFNYEGLRNVRGFFETGRTPTDAERTGRFTELIFDPLTGTAANNFTRAQFPNNTIPLSRMDPVAVKLLPFYPAPNAIPSGGNNFISNQPNTDSLSQYNVRVDYNISASNRLFGRFSADNNDGLMPDTYQNIASISWTQDVNNYNVVLDDTWTLSPTFVANLRYGFTRQRNFRVGYSHGADLTAYGWPASFNAARQEPLLPEIRPQGYLGLSRATLFGRGNQAHAWSGNFSKAAGRHFLKFGSDYRLYLTHWANNGNASGNFAFNTGFTRGPDALSGPGGNAFASFLLGYAATGSIGWVEPFSSNSPYLALYLQDDYRITDKLTLNLGLRWDVEMPRDERYDRLSFFDPDAASPVAAQVGIPGLHGGLRFLGKDGVTRQQATDWNNLGPRFGFSWQALPRTVVRGGYGITFLPIQTRYNGTSNQGFASSTSMVTTLDGGRRPTDVLSNPFPNGFNRPLGASDGLLSSLGQGFSTLLYSEGAVGYSQQWSLNIQRELSTDWLVDAAYAGSKGTKLPMPIPLNALPSELLAQGQTLLQTVPNPFQRVVSTGPLAAATVTRRQLLLPFPQFQGITSNVSQLGSSTYHAFQFKVN
ncbi:MAG TPA: TonB-dependent receptor, partial [Bryobacteraceae bacterium]|nr:TonB-dependent receptor [Bryobacteraceae bacterium]